MQPRQESNKKGGIQRGIQELENILYSARKQVAASARYRYVYLQIFHNRL